MTERIQEFLRNRRNEGQDVEPCLVVDLEVVRDNYQTFSRALPDSRVFVMRGHQDGVVAFGKSVDEAGGALIAVLARALAPAPRP